MPKITVAYDKHSNTFIAADEHQNKITFKVNRESDEATPISSSTTVGPMLSLLMAMGACSGIDIVMILKKQRQAFDSLIIEVEGEREKEVTPALWKNAHVHYILTGNVETAKAEKAAQLSVDKYCSVAETLRRAGCSITYSVTVN